MGVPATRIREIVKGRRSVKADTAARLAEYFGGDAASWLAMQANYDLKTLPTRDEIERKVSVRKQLAAYDREKHGGELMDDAPVGVEAFT